MLSIDCAHACIRQTRERGDHSAKILAAHPCVIPVPLVQLLRASVQATAEYQCGYVMRPDLGQIII